MRRLVGAILVVAMLPAPAGGSDGRTMAIEVARLPGGLLTVPVEVNAAGPLHLLLDTGSTRTMVTPAAAARLGLAVTAGARVVTPAGTREAGESLIGRLRFGPVTVTGLPVVVAPLDAIDAGGLPLDGVLGADVLRRASLLIDASALRVVASTAPGFSARLAGARVPLSVDPLGRMRVSVTTGGPGGVPLILLADSGASMVALFGEAAALAEDAGARRAAGTADGRRGSRVGILRDLAIGAARWPRLPAVLLPGRVRSGHDGLLPLTALGPVGVDAARGELVFVAVRR